MKASQYCMLCGRACLPRRADGQTGWCGAGRQVGVASALLHYGEEPPFSGDGPGDGGSGTIFFTRCVLRCVFCQNWQISQSAEAGRDLEPQQVAEIMLELQAQGALNINLVSPTPYALELAKALDRAKNQGLKLPVIYNSGGYDSLTALKIMDGLVDIYLPDAKLAPALGASLDEPDPRSARLLGVGDYAKVNRLALVEMQRQVGPLNLDEKGLARRGLMIRHLVLPDDLARSSQMLPWLADAFGPELYLSLMAQYHPCHFTEKHPEQFRDMPGLTRNLSQREYDQVLDLAWRLGLRNCFIQDLDAAANYLPDFSRPRVFNS